MSTRIRFRHIVLLCVVFVSANDLTADDVKSAEVTIKDLTLKVPDTWKKVPNSSGMRLATYAIPPIKDDSDNGELTIFSFGGGGGGVSANITRWIGQFGADGRSSKVTRGKAGDNDYYFVDVAGTYNKPIGPPMMRKTEPASGYRMLGVILNLEGKGVYYLKLAGPDATIKAEAKNLRHSFGGNKETEEEFGV